MTTKWEVTKAVRASDLPAPARLILFVLADLADAKTAQIPTTRTPSLTVLAAQTGLGKSTVARHLSELEEAGWITRERPDPKEARSVWARTHYALVVPADFVPNAKVAQDQEEQTPEIEQGLVPERDQGGPGTGLGVVPERDGLVPERDGLVPERELGSPAAGHLYIYTDNYLTKEQINTCSSDDQQLDESSPSSGKALAKPKNGSSEKFDEFWAVYPRRVGKGQARSAWLTALKKPDVTPDRLISAARQHAAYHQAKGTETRYIPHPSSWLNGERYDDDLNPPTSKPAMSIVDQRVAAGLAWAAREREKEAQEEAEHSNRTIKELTA